MTTYTWIGNRGTIDPNDASQAVNWSPNGNPGIGDTLIIGTGATLDAIAGIGGGGITGVTLDVAGNDVFNLTNQNFVQSSITVGTGTVLNLTGTANGLAGFDINTNGGGQNSTQIHQSGTGSTETINTIGSADSAAFIWLDSPGGTLTFNVAQDGTLSGDFYNQGAIFNLGGTLDIAANDTIATGNVNNRFSNASYILIASDTAAASALVTARMDNVSGEFELMGGSLGATLEIDTNFPGGQVISFADGNGTVKIDASTTLGSYGNVNGTPTTVLQNSTERFALFAAGDTIDLAGIASAGLSYTFGNNPTWGDNVLTLMEGATVVGRLRFLNSSAFADGTGSVGGTDTSNFILTSDGNGGTAITVSATPVSVVVGAATLDVGGVAAVLLGPTSSTTIDWGNSANWADARGAGSLPGQYQAVQISNTLAQLAAFNNYTLTVTTAETAGGLTMDDHFLTLAVSAALTLAAVSGQSSGGGLAQLSGTIDITSGGVLTATNLANASGDLVIGTGGVLNLSGVASFQSGIGLGGLSLDQSATIDGGTLTSGGAIILGQNASAGMTAQDYVNVVSPTSTVDVGASVTATYTDVGAVGQSDPNQTSGVTQSSLTIAGPNTVWRDVGGDSTTPYSGAMLVGGGGANVNALGTVVVPGSGNGNLNIDQGATLIDSGFAILGVTGSSTGMASGTVEVQNGAQWTIGTSGFVLPGSVVVASNTLYSATPALLTVGLAGNGSLFINSGGVVTLGTEPTAAGQVNVAIGQGGRTLSATGSSSVSVDGGLLNSSTGAIVVGQRDNGSLVINNGGTVLAGPGGGTAFGVSVGNQNFVLNGVTTGSTGTISIGGSGGTTSLLNDSGDFVDGRNGTGQVTLYGGGSLEVGGVLYLGGYGGAAGASTDTGSDFLMQGGTATIAIATTLYAENTIDLESGAIAMGAGVGAQSGNIVIGSGANLTVLTNGSGVAAKIIDNGGGSLVVAGTLAVNSGMLDVQANVGGSGVMTIAGGGTLELDRTVSNTDTVSLGGTGSTGMLELLTPSIFGGTISNFLHHTTGVDNVVDLFGIGHSGVSLNWTQASDLYGTLQVVTSTSTLDLTIAGYHPGGFTYGADTTNNGLYIYAVDTVPCFAAGTRIATLDGERPVEELAAGDVVLLAGGGSAEITWMGHRHVQVAGHKRPADAAPVRVAAGAFGDGLPARDLLLSPDHAIFAEDVLIPVRALVNGRSIASVDVAQVTYFHVQLARHHVILAEGLACESYLDTDDHERFDDAGSAPCDPVLMEPCVPVMTQGAAVERVRRMLRERMRAVA